MVCVIKTLSAQCLLDLGGADIAKIGYSEDYDQDVQYSLLLPVRILI